MVTENRPTLAELRARALNEALPLVDRIRAEVQRMALVDEILEQRLQEEEAVQRREDGR